MRVDLVDYMGDDLRVANAARVSFNKESEWREEWDDSDPTCPPQIGLKEEDAKLINYLARHNHWTPFSHCMVTVREKVPIFVARQRFKHMVGFSYNEVSRRYVDDTPEFFEPDVWRSRPEGSVKQGSGDKEVEGVVLNDYYDTCLSCYNSLLEDGVAPEQARMVLPQSMYTEYYTTGSLAAWARAYNLRKDKHAQKEIRDLADMWDQTISPLFPVSWKALTNE